MISMEFAFLVLLSLLASSAAIGENKAIKVENVQEVCAAIDGVSRHIETSLSGSSCVYQANGSNACKNCLDLNCSIVVTYFGFSITLKSEISVLPCHDGNLNIPTHAIDSRILAANGEQLFERTSTQSFTDSLVVRLGFFSVSVDISATIENRGNGVFIQVDASTGSGSPYEVFPPTFIPITCTEVDMSVCFGSTSGEPSTPTPTSTNAGTPTSTNIGTLTSTNVGTLTLTKAQTPTSTNAGTPTSTNVGTPTSANAGIPTPSPKHAGAPTPAPSNAGTPTVAAAVWTMFLLVIILSLGSLLC